MRCLSCQHDLQNLSAQSDHRCPECGRAFDPDNPITWSTRPRSLWPNWAASLPIVFGFWLFLATLMFIAELPTGGTSSYRLFLESLFFAFIPTFLVSALLLVAFALGRWQSSS